MSKFTQLHHLLPRGKKFDMGTREERLSSAYKAVFSGNGTKEDTDIVLIDLMQVSGYHITLPASASDAELRELNGSRKVGARIAYLMNWDRSTMEALQQAAMLENEIDFMTQSNGQ